MTTYLRAFSPATLRAAIEACDSRRYSTSSTGPCPFVDAGAALQTPVKGEDLCMPAIVAGWTSRAAALNLPKKGVKRETDREAYMQGALAALCAAGLMTVERCNQIAFLTAVGRLDQYMAEQEAKNA